MELTIVCKSNSNVFTTLFQKLLQALKISMSLCIRYNRKMWPGKIGKERGKREGESKRGGREEINLTVK